MRRAEPKGSIVLGLALAASLVACSVHPSRPLSSHHTAHPLRAGAGSAIQTIFIILMENHDWSQILGSPSAPYINEQLLPQSSYADQYYNPPRLHPSLPNYLWLEAGDNFGIRDNNLPKINHQDTTDHLASYLESQGISWKTYQEGIPGTDCPLLLLVLNRYAPKHNPFVYFDDLTDGVDPQSPHCIAKVRPYSELADDLVNLKVAQYNFITPDLCHDMHDTFGCETRDSILNGDLWLSREVPKILASNAFKNDGALFITWDEGRGISDGPIGMIVLSPLAVGGGYHNSIPYSHSSTLRTFQEILNVGPYLRDAANATSLSDLFSVYP
jgi:hypothetical protein